MIAMIPSGGAAGTKGAWLNEAARFALCQRVRELLTEF